MPHLWWCVVRSTSLCIQKSFGYFGDIQITKFEQAILSHEQVGALDISVHYFEVVESLQTLEQLDEVGPALGFWNEGALLFALGDSLEKVSGICKLHHDV